MRGPPIVFELLRKSFWRWAGFEPTKIERVLLSVHSSTSKPPRLDGIWKLGIQIPIVSDKKPGIKAMKYNFHDLNKGDRVGWLNK